jgi:PhoH-like ATPase
MNTPDAADSRPRALVLDTSVLVHDPNALATFRNGVVVIPIYVVMELDELKTSRRADVAAAARAASRTISALREYGELHDAAGIVSPITGTRYFVWATHDGPGLRALRGATTGRKIDVHILQSALSFKSQHEMYDVVLLSKDVNLRILANFEGLGAEDYDQDRVQLSSVWTGFRELAGARIADVQAAFPPQSMLYPETLELHDLMPNEHVIVREDDREALLRYDATDGKLHPVAREFRNAAGIAPRNIEQRMALSLLLDPDIELVTMFGKAGTGKTFLALAAGLAQLSLASPNEGYSRLLLSKPVVPMGNDIGFLPGDFDEKMQPWMMSFFDNLDQLINGDDDAGPRKGATRSEKGWEMLFKNGQIEVQAIHSIRGRSISKSFMVIDEAQNLTPHEVKTIITRAANGTKVVLAGDPFQVDNPFLDQHSNGLVYVAERLKASTMTGSVFFSKGERSRLAELAATRL